MFIDISSIDNRDVLSLGEFVAEASSMPIHLSLSQNIQPSDNFVYVS